MQKLNGNIFKKTLPGVCCVTLNSGDFRRFGKGKSAAWKGVLGLVTSAVFGAHRPGFKARVCSSLAV